MEDNETKHFIKEVQIEEFFSRENGEVYWNWRFANTKDWHKELTAFKEVPYYQVKSKELLITPTNSLKE